jgi:alkylglycerol monooxygenase
VLLQGVAAFLWLADRMPLAQSAVWLGVLAASLWAIGAVMQGRISMTEALMVESAALATATAALGFLDLHRIFKPLTMALAMAFVVLRAGGMAQLGRFDALLLGALVMSLAGDAFLMFPGYFIPGLVSFLVAHLLYIALFRMGQRWFPSRRALAITLGVGAVMYAYLWQGGLPAALRVPVAAYVIVIALMAAQAIGRATVLRDGAAVGVAVGAGFFMLSDSLLAVNKFVSPLPMAQVGVLSTYYLAQILIVRLIRPGQ